MDCLGLDQLIPPRVSVRHDIGDGVGYDRGFSYLEGFIPVYQPNETSVVFSDLRVVNFDDASRWEFNAGGGYRTYFDLFDVVLGVNAFYDGRHTDANFFNQIGIGGELLFNWWELRANGYYVVGDHRKLASDTGPVIGGFAGNQVLINRLQVFDVAMSGADAEIGVRLPWLTRCNPRIYAGFYHYSAEGMHTANGIRGRFEAALTPNISVHFSIQNDAVFDTTVNGGLAFHLGGTRAAPSSDTDLRSVEERLGQRVVRDVNIVIAQQTVFQQEAFTLVDDTTTSGTVSSSGSPPASSGGTPPSCNPPPCPPVYCLCWHHHRWEWCHPRHHHHYHDCDDDDHHHGHHGVCFYWPPGCKPPKILCWN
jgi:hypothetical protein